MLTAEAMSSIREQIEHLVAQEQGLLRKLCGHAAHVRSQLSRIQPRSVTAVSLVGTDGGNNKIQYDPLFLDVIRVVDSSSHEYHIEAVSASSPLRDLNAYQFDADGKPRTALGRLMHFLDKRSIADICPVFEERDDKPRGASWVGEYRGLHEWAVLFDLVCYTTFGTDTIIVRDGPFREKMFKPGLFSRIRQGLREGIARQLAQNRRHLYLVGVLKKSKFLQKYRLALALEQTFHTGYPCFAQIPLEILKEAYKFDEWLENKGKGEDFVGGVMFAAKFGSNPYDPVWMVDVFESQASEAARIMGFLLNDALTGFPIPCYPACLQRAHDASALVDFDMDILQQLVHGSLRQSLGERSHLIDKLSLQESDPSVARYL